MNYWIFTGLIQLITLFDFVLNELTYAW